MAAQFTPDLVGFQPEEFSKNKKRKVKTQTEKIFDTWSESIIVNAISYFSEDGKLMQTILNPEIHAEEALDTIKYTYAYNDKHAIQSLTIHGFDIIPIEYGFFYKKGVLTECIIASAEARKFTYEYDKKGNIIKSIAKGNVFTYDEEGNASDEPEWVTMEETEYTWNEKGQLINERGYYRSEFSYHAIYTYDAAGNLTGERFCYDAERPNEASTIITFIYDENGFLVKRITKEVGSNEIFESFFEYTLYN